MIVIFNFSQAKGGFEDTIAPTVQYCAAGVFKAKHIFHIRSKYDQCRSAVSISRRIKTGFKSFGVVIVKTKTDFNVAPSIYEETNKLNFFAICIIKGPISGWQVSTGNVAILTCTLYNVRSYVCF